MADVEIIREWLAKADEDFEFARYNFEEGRPFYAQICFHFQQAAEKYLRAYIVARELDFRKIHELPLLLKICLSDDPSLEELKEDCEYLSPFYIESRYPVHWPKNLSRTETEKALESASRIRMHIKQKLDI
jgi:HEPN domain-containing protein